MLNPYSALPGWRRPLWDAHSSTDHGEAVSLGLRGALLDLTSDEPQSFADLAGGVREHWGEATGREINLHLIHLVREGALRRVGGGYVRGTEGDE